MGGFTSRAADLFLSSCSMFLAALATSSSASFCSTVYSFWFAKKICRHERNIYVEGETLIRDFLNSEAFPGTARCKR